MICELNLWDIIFFVVGIISSIYLSLKVISWFKPKLEINNVRFEVVLDEKTNKKIIKFAVQNKDPKYFSFNIKVEACIVEGNTTYHLKLDFPEFLLIDKKGSPNTADSKTFIAFDIHNSLIERNIVSYDVVLNKLEHKNNYLRIRVFSCHEKTGFGKVIQEKYKYYNQTNSFKLIP
jgi:hypothetical protein